MGETEQGAVYKAICGVALDMATKGIAKDRRNQQQGFAFRGIDDVFNAIAPVLCKHALVIVPRFLSRSISERQTQKGGTLFTVTVEAEFDFVCADDGSTHTARTFGEAMDSGDKATNKAMSAAYKYAVLQTFCIPTVGDNDADAHSHRPGGKTKASDNVDTTKILPLIDKCNDTDALNALWKPLTVAERTSVKDYFMARKDELEGADG